jgi:nuclear pore complex protein Nup62
VSVPVPSLLKGMTLEDIVNRWSSELDERVREFTHLAGEVKAWDSVLLSNGDEISKLYNGLQALDPITHTVNESLDYVENQQKEMEAVLDAYESQLDELLSGRQGSSSALTLGGSGGGSSAPSNANSEREKAYQLAESLNNQLDDLSRSLTSLINEVNSLSGSSSSESQQQLGADPVSAITAILNAHLGSLSWIEKNVDTLNEQVGDLEGKVKSASNGRWPGLSTSQSARSATPSRSMGVAGGMGRNAFGTPQRQVLGSQGTPTNRSGTPSRLGQSSLSRGSVYGRSLR